MAHRFPSFIPCVSRIYVPRAAPLSLSLTAAGFALSGVCVSERNWGIERGTARSKRRRPQPKLRRRLGVADQGQKLDVKQNTRRVGRAQARTTRIYAWLLVSCPFFFFHIPLHEYFNITQIYIKDDVRNVGDNTMDEPRWIQTIEPEFMLESISRSLETWLASRQIR